MMYDYLHYALYAAGLVFLVMLGLVCWADDVSHPRQQGVGSLAKVSDSVVSE